MRILSAVAALVFVLLSGQVFAAPTNITVAAKAWAGYVNEDGSGYYLEVIKTIFEKKGFAVDVKIVPYARSLDMLATKKCDVVLGVYKADVASGLFPDIPFEIDNVDVIVSQGLASSWQGIESLEGKKVGAVKGYGFDRFIIAKMDYKEISNTKSLIKMLNIGRLDAVLDYESDIAKIQKDVGGDVNYVLKRAVLKNNVYAVFAHNSKGKVLLEVFNNGIKEMHANGDLRALMLKNIGTASTYPE